MTTHQQLIIYGSTVFLVSWLLQILAIATTGDINSAQARPWLFATMLAPTLVTIYFLVKNKSWKAYLLWRPNGRILQVCLVAVLVPTITAFLILMIIQLAGYGKSNWFNFTSTGVDISGGPFLLGLGKQNWLTFFFNILLTGIVYSIISGIVAAGEEFAWRGFFQQTLTERFGKLRGIALLGFIWSNHRQLCSFTPANDWGFFFLRMVNLVNQEFHSGRHRTWRSKFDTRRYHLQYSTRGADDLPTWDPDSRYRFYWITFFSVVA
jgi:membrane protease YdiL (CAAX protease family)